MLNLFFLPFFSFFPLFPFFFPLRAPLLHWPKPWTATLKSQIYTQKNTAKIKYCNKKYTTLYNTNKNIFIKKTFYFKESINNSFSPLQTRNKRLNPLPNDRISKLRIGLTPKSLFIVTSISPAGYPKPMKN